MDKAVDSNRKHAWRLDDEVDFIEAQFLLGDFCLDHFPNDPQFSRAIQAAESVADIRNELKPVVNLMQMDRKDLVEEFTALIHQLNATK